MYAYMTCKYIRPNYNIYTHKYLTLPFNIAGKENHHVGNTKTTESHHLKSLIASTISTAKLEFPFSLSFISIGSIYPFLSSHVNTGENSFPA